MASIGDMPISSTSVGLGLEKYCDLSCIGLRGQAAKMDLGAYFPLNITKYCIFVGRINHENEMPGN